MYFSPLAATTPQTTPWHKGSPSHLCCDALVQCVITTPVLIGVALRFSLTLHLHLCRWILSTLCSESQVSPFSEMSRSSLLILSCACPRMSCRGSTCSLNSSASPLTPIISAHTQTHTHTNGLSCQPRLDVGSRERTTTHLSWSLQTPFRGRI